MPHRKAKERKIPRDYVPPEKLAGFRTAFTPDESQTALTATQQFYAETSTTVTSSMLCQEPYRHVFLRILASSINAGLLETKPPRERAKIIAALGEQLTLAPAKAGST